MFITKTSLKTRLLYYTAIPVTCAVTVGAGFGRNGRFADDRKTTLPSPSYNVFILICSVRHNRGLCRGGDGGAGGTRGSGACWDSESVSRWSLGNRVC